MIWLLLVALLYTIKVRGGNESRNLQDVSVLLKSLSGTHVDFSFRFRQRRKSSKPEARDKNAH
jgi:hypothetical protein